MTIDIASIPQIIAELRLGKIIILLDEENRENEGDLLMAAEFVTPESINFMVTYGRGLVCLTLTETHCAKLNLDLMTSKNCAKYSTNFTQSVEAASGIETGISAVDRAHTIKVAVDKNAKPNDLVQPGHIFPVRAVQGGVLVRAGHTEAGCDLTSIAGLTPAAVICEILKNDGTMARLPDLLKFSKQHNLKIGTIADLIKYRSEHESVIDCIGQRFINTPWGLFNSRVYKDTTSGSFHLALFYGKISPNYETLVRVHEPTCLLDVLDIESDSHSWTIDKALKLIKKTPPGILLLMNFQASSNEFFTKIIRKYNVNQKIKKLVKENNRSNLLNYGIGAQILRDLNVGKMRLLSFPRKIPSMTGFSLTISGFIDPPK